MPNDRGITKPGTNRGTGGSNLDRVASDVQEAQRGANRATPMDAETSQVTTAPTTPSASSTGVSASGGVPTESASIPRSPSSTSVSSQAEAMQGVEPSIRSNASANGVASTDNSSAPSGALRGTQITNELSSPQPSGFVTEKTEANKMLDSAASAHVDGLLINKRLPLGSNELAKDARGEILKIAEKNFDKMQNGSWEEKKAIAAEINKHGQKVEYSNGKTHAPMDLPGVQQLGKVTETFAKARAESLVPQGVTGTPETTDIPPKTQQRVAELMSGPRGFENAVMQRAVDKTAAPAQIFNGEVKAHSQTNVRSSNLTATIANSQAAIQKELAPYTAEGPDGAKRMAAAIGEISKNRDAIVADRGLRKAELYAGVNEKAAPAGRERTDRSRDRSAGGGRE